jgi:hypothetical protein
MRAILKSLMNPSRSYATKAWIAMLAVLTICLCATVANAQTAPLQPINVSQVNWLNPVLKGGVQYGDAPDGQNIAVNSNGDIFVGTNTDLEMVNEQTGVVTSIIGTNTAGFSAISGVTIDAQNNLYVAEAYGATIWKVPYLGNGAYAVFDDGTSTVCANFGANSSLDTLTCTMPHLTFSGNSYYFQIENIVVDKQGDLFWEMLPSYGEGALWECSVACLGGTGSPIVVFQEPVNAAAQLQIGSMAFDPSGNLFFTDMSGSGKTSNLNELLTSTSAGYGGVTTGFAVAPTVLYSYTPASAGDEIDGVAIDPATGTVYMATLYSGVFAFPNSAGVVNPAAIYGISTQGSKLLALDGSANPIIVSYQGIGDTVGRILVNNVTLPTVMAGSSSSTSYNTTATIAGVSTVVTGSTVTVMDNATTCAASPSITVDASGADAAMFTSATPAIVLPATALLDPVCSATLSGGASYPTTVTFTPTAGGTQTATLTTTDALSNTGTATVTGVGVVLTTQTITFAPTVLTYPVSAGTITLSATTTATGLTVSFASTTSSVCTVASGATTATLLTAGTCTIEATQAGNSTYAAATPVSVNFTITLTPQTITFTAPTTKSVAYGVAPITVSTTGGASGNPVVLTVASGPGTLSGTASGSTLTVTGVGTITIDANQAGNSTYAVAGQSQLTITVSQASQTITFAPTSPVTFTTTPITLTATGGASGNPVTFSVTSGPGTITGTLAAPTLTLTGLGTVVVAANQANNTDYAAAPTVTASIVVNTISTVATPTISPAAGAVASGTPVSITDSTGVAIWYTTDGTMPGVGTGTSTLYTSSTNIIITAAETVQAIGAETGYTNSAVASAAYTILPPTITAPSLSVDTLTIAAGQTGTLTITVTPEYGLTTPITFACTGLPTGATCTFNPNPVTPSGSTPVTTTLTIATTSASAALHNSNPFLPGGATLAAALCFLGWKKRRNVSQLLLLLVVSVIGLSLFTACGGSSSPTSTSTVGITATAGTVTQTINLTLTVN